VNLLTDQELALLAEDGMIEPFVPQKMRHIDQRPAVSYGLSHVGYDCRAGNDAKHIIARYSTRGLQVDVKDSESYVTTIVETHHDDSGEFYLLSPYETIIVPTIEVFDLPEFITGFLYTKSTYNRTGIFLPAVVLEPGWRGRLSVPVSNMLNFSQRLYIGEGLAQIVFFRHNRPRDSYEGPYQNSLELTLSKVGN